MEDNISVHYFGPALLVRSVLSPKIYFMHGISAGYLSYINDAKLISSLSIEGNTLGVNAFMGCDFLLNSTHAIGVEFSFLAGTLNTIRVNGQLLTLEKNQYEGLSRIDITVGFRWYK